MDRKSIGSFIAALRKAKGMTQKDLAELLHVSDKTVSRWEVGDGRRSSRCWRRYSALHVTSC